MILQLTSAGRALLNANPAGVVLTRADFGSTFNATLPEEPTGIIGSQTYSSNVVWSPQIVDPNTLRYSLYLAASIPTFAFGNVALYSNSTLVGVGVSPAQVQKQGPANSEDGNSLKLDIFLSTEGSQKYAVVEVQTPGQISSFPRVNAPDLLVPPAINQMNAYVVYGTEEDSLAYLAFADPTGKWSFSSKPEVHFAGILESCGEHGLGFADMSGSYDGEPSDLVLQFVSGAKRGYCRTVESITAEGITWATALPESQRPVQGDAFILVGPQVSQGGGGGGGDGGSTAFSDLTNGPTSNSLTNQRRNIWQWPRGSMKQRGEGGLVLKEDDLPLPPVQWANGELPNESPLLEILTSDGGLGALKINTDGESKRYELSTFALTPFGELFANTSYTNILSKMYMSGSENQTSTVEGNFIGMDFFQNYTGWGVEGSFFQQQRVVAEGNNFISEGTVIEAGRFYNSYGTEQLVSSAIRLGGFTASLTTGDMTAHRLEILGGSAFADGGVAEGVLIKSGDNCRPNFLFEYGSGITELESQRKIRINSDMGLVIGNKDVHARFNDLDIDVNKGDHQNAIEHYHPGDSGVSVMPGRIQIVMYSNGDNDFEQPVNLSREQPSGSEWTISTTPRIPEGATWTIKGNITAMNPEGHYSADFHYIVSRFGGDVTVFNNSDDDWGNTKVLSRTGNFAETDIRYTAEIGTEYDADGRLEIWINNPPNECVATCVLDIIQIGMTDVIDLGPDLLVTFAGSSDNPYGVQFPADRPSKWIWRGAAFANPYDNPQRVADGVYSVDGEPFYSMLGGIEARVGDDYFPFTDGILMRRLEVMFRPVALPSLAQELGTPNFFQAEVKFVGNYYLTFTIRGNGDEPYTLRVTDSQTYVNYTTTVDPGEFYQDGSDGINQFALNFTFGPTTSIAVFMNGTEIGTLTTEYPLTADYSPLKMISCKAGVINGALTHMESFPSFIG